MLPPKYEEDTIIHCRLMAHFSCINYVPVWAWPLTYFHQNWVTWPAGHAEHIEFFCIFLYVVLSVLKFVALCVEICDRKCRFCGPVARQTSLPWQLVCAPLVWWSSSCQRPTGKLIDSTTTEMYSTYRSRFMTITIFDWPPTKSPNFHVFWWGEVRSHFC